VRWWENGRAGKVLTGQSAGRPGPGGKRPNKQGALTDNAARGGGHPGPRHPTAGEDASEGGEPGGVQLGSSGSEPRTKGGRVNPPVGRTEKRFKGRATQAGRPKAGPSRAAGGLQGGADSGGVVGPRVPVKEGRSSSSTAVFGAETARGLGDHRAVGPPWARAAQWGPGDFFSGGHRGAPPGTPGPNHGGMGGRGPPGPNRAFMTPPKKCGTGVMQGETPPQTTDLLCPRKERGQPPGGPAPSSSRRLCLLSAGGGGNRGAKKRRGGRGGKKKKRGLNQKESRKNDSY